MTTLQIDNPRSLSGSLRSATRWLAEELDAEAAQRSGATWTPLPHQTPPAGDWDIWMLLAGRGAGKTDTGAHWCLEQLRTFGAKARIGVGGPTISDVRGTCAEGPSGLITIARDEFEYNRTFLEAKHKDGGYVRFVGSEEPARWNGPQWTHLWWDELALANEESFKQSRFGLRLPPHPRMFISTTPKRRQFVRDLEKRPGTVVTRATMFDNPHLAPEAVQVLKEEYEGTTLGRQELYGEWIEDMPGALWQRGWIEKSRVTVVPPLRVLGIGIDPSGSGSPESDECGIIAAGLGHDGEAYVLADRSIRAQPDQWAHAAMDLYDELEADFVVVEINYGGQMVESTLRVVNPNVGFRSVVATRGKEVRAQPIAMLYEKGKVHHVGTFPSLEDEFTSWVPGAKSPNRLDAAVWILTQLLPTHSKPQRII